MSEPKTPDEFLRELNRAFQALYPSADALDNAVGAIEARDEQIRQQEKARAPALVNDAVRAGAEHMRARVAELERELGFARAGVASLQRALSREDLSRTHVSKARVRELCDAAKATGMALEMARAREVLQKLHDENLEQLNRVIKTEAERGEPLGFSGPVWQGRRSEDRRIAKALGIDLEGTDG